jgi:hypothetical protein
MHWLDQVKKQIDKAKYYQARQILLMANLSPKEQRVYWTGFSKKTKRLLKQLDEIAEERKHEMD